MQPLVPPPVFGMQVVTGGLIAEVVLQTEGVKKTHWSHEGSVSDEAEHASYFFGSGAPTACPILIDEQILQKGLQSLSFVKGPYDHH